MKDKFIREVRRKKVSFLIFLCCSLLLCFAYFLELVQGLNPCPLCTLQRICMAVGGFLALIAFIHNPEKPALLAYIFLQVVSFSIGGLLAGRQIYLQSLPPELVPSCGPDLDYLLEIFPFFEVLQMIVFEDGSCAEVLWKFLGFSIPQWTILSFTLLIHFIFRKYSRETYFTQN